VSVLFAHGSGLDELAIFLFPVFIGTGFWLLTRQRRGSGEPEEAQPAQVASSAPRPVAAVPDPDVEPDLTNAKVSPFHKMITRPAPVPPSASPTPPTSPTQPVSRKPTLRSVSDAPVAEAGGGRGSTAAS
jgi:hypothetical protein